MPFCIGCGVRVDGGAERCPACESKVAESRRCPQCGAPAGGAASRFCVVCGAPLGAPVARASGVGTPQATPTMNRMATPPAVQASSTPHPLPNRSGETAGSRRSVGSAAGPAADPVAVSSGSLVETTRRERQAVYQRLGRSLVAACYEGAVAYPSLPKELGQQIQAGIQTIRKGHAGLVEAGICPRCLEAGLGGEPMTCPRCHLVVPPPRAA
jgi:hypothetical protein